MSQAAILVIGPLPPPYHGGATATELLCGVLDQAGIGYALLDIADRRSISNIGRFDWQNVTLALQHGAQFLKMLRRRPAAVYIPISQNTLAFLRDCLFLVPARLTRRKIIIHLHGSAFREFYESAPGWLRRLIRWIFRDVARVIVLGESLRQLFAGLVPEQRIAVVPNGLEDTLFRDRPAAGGGGRRVTYLANLLRQKGFMDVIKAVPLTQAHIADVCFTFAGAPYVDEVEEASYLLAEQRVEDNVTLTGVLVGAAKADLLLSSDVFVFPPRHPEGHPYVLLEAMAASLPIVTTDSGAIKETVLDGVNGFIVPARNPEAIAEKIVQLLQDEPLRRRMGQASRERFLQQYTLDRWAGAMIRVFQEVLEEP